MMMVALDHGFDVSDQLISNNSVCMLNHAKCYIHVANWKINWITVPRLYWTIKSMVVQIYCHVYYNGRVYGALVQFGCYQHRYVITNGRTYGALVYTCSSAAINTGLIDCVKAPSILG